MFRKIIYLLVCYSLFTSVALAAEIQLDTKVTGLHGSVLANVQDRLAIAREALGPNPSPNDIATFYQNAPQTIQHAMQPFGYFHAEIQSHLQHKNNHWTAVFTIQSGTPLRIGAVNIDIEGPGDNNPAIMKCIHDLPIQSGQIFKTESYEQAKENLFQIAQEQGYLNASIEKKSVRIDVNNNRADIDLTMQTGPRYYFGKVTFNQHTFSDEFLQRFMGFHPGEPFSSQKLLKFQENLSSSNFFRDVSVTPLLQQSQDQQVPVDVSLVPSKSQQYNIGLGYGTFTGPRLTLGANFRHLTDTGHHLDMQLKLSPVLSGLASQYVIPGANPLTDSYNIGANVQKFMPKNGTSISSTLSFSAIKQLGDWKRNLSLSYLAERFKVTGVDYRNSGLLIPSAQFTRIKADNLLNPHFGTKLDFVVRGAAQGMASTTNFVQTEVKGKAIFSPTEMSRVIFFGDFGYTAVNDLNTLPLSLSYFAGGLDSVRGFPYSYFGPGKYLKIGSVELQHRLYGKLSGAVFYDVGMADNHLNAPMGRGKGVGLIYDSVIGPIKTYVGFGTLQNKPRRFDLELSIGPDL